MTGGRETTQIGVIVCWDSNSGGSVYRSRGKRLLDVTAGSAALVVLAPVGLLVVAAVRLKLGSPVLFRQTRPGLHGEPFEMLKFRTMTNQRDKAGDLLPDEVRLTRFGRLLRSTSIDELPELVNIVRGEMSLVGPRPLLMEYLPLYDARQRRRHDVRPGLTGLAQVSGRNNVPWSEKFELDVQYVEKLSLKLDLWILWRTVLQVIRRSGITEDGSATMTRFSGQGSEAFT